MFAMEYPLRELFAWLSVKKVHVVKKSVHSNNKVYARNQGTHCTCHSTDLFDNLLELLIIRQGKYTLKVVSIRLPIDGRSL